MAVERKIKSIQIFREPTRCIQQGNRAGICVTQFDSKQFERGLICSPNTTKYVHCGIIAVNRIKYFKYALISKSKFHISIGYETRLGTIELFAAKKSCSFSFDEEYEYIDGLDPVDENVNEDTKYFMLIEFNKPVLVTDDALVIGSKLDIVSNNACRIAFWGNLLVYCKDKDYKITFLPKLKTFKRKSRNGIIERIAKDGTVIVRSMFRKESQLEIFIGLKVTTSFGDIGRIDSAFGKRGKIRVCFESNLSERAIEILNEKKADNGRKNYVEVVLNYKKCIYDNKTIYQ